VADVAGSFVRLFGSNPVIHSPRIRGGVPVPNQRTSSEFVSAGCAIVTSGVGRV